MRLLLLCLGNICRSPMAEGALRARLKEAGLDHLVTVDSAGTGDWHAGQAPDPRAIACARRHGVDIAHLRARQLLPLDHHRFDWLLCADAQNLRDVLASAPAGGVARVDLLLRWAGLAPVHQIEDPYQGGEEAFERAWDRVDAAARGIVERLQSGPSAATGA